MSSLFRSEEMVQFQMYIPSEIAPACVAEFGELGCVEFCDLNADVNAFQRTFVKEIRRLDEVERKMRFLRAQIAKEHLPIKEYDAGIDGALYAQVRTQQSVDDLEARVSESDGWLRQMNASYETLNKRFIELTELQYVLRETATFFDAAGRRDPFPDQHEDAGLLNNAALIDVGDVEHRGGGGEVLAAHGTGIGSLNLEFVSGTIDRRRMALFETILFRALRGNLYMNFVELSETIQDPETDEPVAKNVFIIFANGRELINKIRKISESLGATLYPVSEDGTKRRDDMMEVQSRLIDLTHVLQSTRETRLVELAKIAELLDMWQQTVRKEKAIYDTMNLFHADANRKAMIAEGWTPLVAYHGLQMALADVARRTQYPVQPLLHELRTRRTPPTFHRLNKFTNAFQEIVDAYGIATYQEVNPGLFATITFPFLFAVMFGDFGHGIIASLAAGWLCRNEGWLAKKKWGEDWNMIFSGRYIVLLMGLFSIYTGLIYNDIFSKPMNLFGTGWSWVQANHGNSEMWVGEKHWTYIIGVDPAWHSAENKLLFMNSYKMKMSVIMGIVHMTFGICLQIWNHKRFNNQISIWVEFLPQIIFLQSIFGYLSLLIIYKWSVNWTDPGQAPGLLNTLIYMILSPGNVDESMQLYPGQAAIQTLLLLIALVCVPVMLFGKPYYLYKEHNKHREAGYANLVGERPSLDGPGAGPGAGEADDVMLTTAPSADAGAGAGGEHGGEHGEGFDFGEIMIHQMIHTIEFVLGCVSNTASYLRLWALSLAHAQLSEVLWSMILGNVFTMEGGSTPIALVCGFAVWFTLTVFILLLMEGLSAFLHALRLHWVEFMNKFYGGTGKRFEPFAFSRVLSDEEM